MESCKSANYVGRLLVAFWTLQINAGTPAAASSRALRAWTAGDSHLVELRSGHLSHDTQLAPLSHLAGCRYSHCPFIHSHTSTSRDLHCGNTVIQYPLGITKSSAIVHESTTRGKWRGAAGSGPPKSPGGCERGPKAREGRAGALTMIASFDELRARI
ncbi:hypothetical protein J6590_047672 [Homalodisca vitripennis]|nr:hypothetical protein J6590_047672 [Homalodisca vitripennis]